MYLSIYHLSISLFLSLPPSSSILLPLPLSISLYNIYIYLFFSIFLLFLFLNYHYNYCFYFLAFSLYVLDVDGTNMPVACMHAAEAIVLYCVAHLALFFSIQLRYAQPLEPRPDEKPLTVLARLPPKVGVRLRATTATPSAQALRVPRPAPPHRELPAQTFRQSPAAQVSRRLVRVRDVCMSFLHFFLSYALFSFFFLSSPPFFSPSTFFLSRQQ